MSAYSTGDGGLESTSVKGCKNETSMVLVRNAFKDYGLKTKVLRGFNMCVEKGSIYGFLGPSGCGKTTLLQCLVGRKKLDSGNIHMGVQYYNEVGYMPQDLAVVDELKISEMVNYYGIIFGMTKDDIQKRWAELQLSFEMPPWDQIIGTLSGGQKRRVSLCITFLHNPKLLILDEPTVGVDPLLSEKIWNYMKEQTKSGESTIILTTHYIEEAKSANKVGLMRNGVLLEEDSPQEILNKYGHERLEEVFFEISKTQDNKTDMCTPDSTSNFIKELNLMLHKSCKNEQKPTIHRKEWFSFNRLCAHVNKNVLFLARNSWMFFFLLALPVIICSLFVTAVGTDPTDIKVGIVNNELDTGISDCDNPPYNCTKSFPASCYLIHELHTANLSLVMYNNYQTARSAAVHNKIWAFLEISKNYTEALHQRSYYNLNTPDDMVEDSSINAWIDMSDAIIGTLIRRKLFYSYFEYLKKFNTYCGWPAKVGVIPIRFQDNIYGGKFPAFIDFALPSILIICSYFWPIISIAAALLPEKRNGFLERSFTSGMTHLEIFLGHIVVSLTIFLAQLLIMLIIFFIIADKTILGSIYLASLLCTVCGINGAFNGYLISTVFDSDRSATYAGTGTFFVLLFTSGVLWPLEGMDPFLRELCMRSPLTKPAESMRLIMQKAWDIDHPDIYESFIIAGVWFIIFSIAIIFVNKVKNLYIMMTN